MNTRYSELSQRCRAVVSTNNPTGRLQKTQDAPSRSCYMSANGQWAEARVLASIRPPLKSSSVSLSCFLDELASKADSRVTMCDG